MGRVALVGFLAGIALAVGCRKEPQWFCQTKEHAEAHERGRAKCYRLREYCEGGCLPQMTAYCFEVGDSVHMRNMEMPADRFCYTTPEICAEVHRIRGEPGRPCAAHED